MRSIRIALFFFLSLSFLTHAQAGEMPMTIDYKLKTDEFWKKNLSPEVYNICRAKGTEPAGSGKYAYNKDDGTYYCACCGGDYPLYPSSTKFDSGTGWPSFWDPIAPENVTLHKDTTGFLGTFFPRTEVLCARCGAHLGHVFDDGPKEHTGKRYCMNSLALSFTPTGQTPKNSLESKE